MIYHTVCVTLGLSNRSTAYEYVMLYTGIGVMVVGLVSLGLSLLIGAAVISLGVGFIAVGIAFQTGRVISENRTSQIDEKIADMFGYAAMFQAGPSRTAQTPLNMDLLLEKVLTDITALARMRRPPPDQMTRLTRAMVAVVEQLRSHGFGPEADQVQEAFRTLFRT